MNKSEMTTEDHLEMIAGGWTAILGHEIGAAKGMGNTADMVESAMLRAARQAWNDALEKAAKACEDALAFNPDDSGETYAGIVRALRAAS